MEAEYSKIANFINAACPLHYEQAILTAKVGEDWSDQQVWCNSSSGNFQPNMDSVASFNIGKALRQIRKQMTLPGQEAWSKCTFTLHSDGKFKFDVEYDD